MNQTNAEQREDVGEQNQIWADPQPPPIRTHQVRAQHHQLTSNTRPEGWSSARPARAGCWCKLCVLWSSARKTCSWVEPSLELNHRSGDQQKASENIPCWFEMSGNKHQEGWWASWPTQSGPAWCWRHQTTGFSWAQSNHQVGGLTDGLKMTGQKVQAWFHPEWNYEKAVQELTCSF